jgi:superfamily II DNA or RNA helicase
MQAQIKAFKRRRVDAPNMACAGLGLEIPKDALSNPQLKNLIDSLTFQIYNPFDKTSTETQAFYRTDDTTIHVPRCYPSPCPVNWDTLDDGHPIEIEFEGTLKQEQMVALSALNHRLDSPPFASIACLPCGGGKTVLAIAIAAHFKRRTLIVVHKEFLLRQWQQRIHQFASKSTVGIVQGKTCQFDCDFVIATFQTLYARDYDLVNFGLVVLDEAHHVAANTFNNVFYKTKAKRILGLSATPTRKDD